MIKVGAIGSVSEQCRSARHKPSSPQASPCQRRPVGSVAIRARRHLMAAPADDAGSVAPAHVRECPLWIVELLSLAEDKLIRVPTESLRNKYGTKSGSFTMTVPIFVFALFVGMPACSVGYQSK